MEPRFFFLEMGWGIYTSQSSPPHGEGDWWGWHHPTLQHPTPPISPHIDEDALEGLYFAF